MAILATSRVNMPHSRLYFSRSKLSSIPPPPLCDVQCPLRGKSLLVRLRTVPIGDDDDKYCCGTQKLAIQSIPPLIGNVHHNLK